MKVILYMAITANGMIAKEDDDTSFVSKASWKGFIQMAKRIGNVVIGRRTYEVCAADGTFPLPVLNIVATRKPTENKWGVKVIFTGKQPKQILQLLQRKGFRTALIGGGSLLNASFMKACLIDEIYLDVEPIVLGKGIRLFADANFEAKLKLIGIKNLSRNEIQLHYKVVK